jgi:hypothetical protein
LIPTRDCFPLPHGARCSPHLGPFHFRGRSSSVPSALMTDDCRKGRLREPLAWLLGCVASCGLVRFLGLGRCGRPPDAHATNQRDATHAQLGFGSGRMRRRVRVLRFCTIAAIWNSAQSASRSASFVARFEESLRRHLAAADIASILVCRGDSAPCRSPSASHEFGEAAHEFCARSGSPIPDKRGRAECGVGR